MRYLVGILALIMANCSGKDPDYMHSTEERLVCHWDYAGGNDWNPVEEKMPIVLAYANHIGKHPRDYWGKCKLESKRQGMLQYN